MKFSPTWDGADARTRYQSYRGVFESCLACACPVVCLKKKRLLESRRARYGLTGRLGITFIQRYSIKMLPTHDQFYAAVAACLAYLFKSRKTCDYGGELFEDTNLGILREGLIVQPVKSS